MNVAVHLFRDLPQERWPSMENYADGLEQGFTENPPQGLEIVPIAGPALAPNLRGPLGQGLTLLARCALYPLRARTQQGAVNHVLDHSYGHLVHFLDPRRTVVTVHDLVPLAFDVSRGRLGLSHALWRWALAGVLKAARVITDSHFTRRELLRLTDYPPSRAHVVPLAAGQAFRPLAPSAHLEAVRARYRLPQSPFLLHVGHGAPRKNLTMLFEAVALAQGRSGRAVHLVQVGAELSAVQRTLIGRLGLAGRVRFLGSVPAEDLPALYNLARAFVFPSLYEGFGLPVLEALACGTPVVCADAASLPEVAGPAALLVAPGDAEALAEALVQVLDDEDLRGRLREAGLRRAAAFTWARTAAATAAVYRLVAGLSGAQTADR